MLGRFKSKGRKKVKIVPFHKIGCWLVEMFQDSVFEAEAHALIPWEFLEQIFRTICIIFAGFGADSFQPYFDWTIMNTMVFHMRSLDIP